MASWNMLSSLLVVLVGVQRFAPQIGWGSHGGWGFCSHFFLFLGPPEFIFIMVTASGAVAQWELGVLSD